MAVVALRQKGKMVMVLLPTDGIPIIDLDKDIVEYPVQPTKDDLMSLTKSVLQEMVQSAGFQGSLSKLTKSELSKMCMEKWDLISKSYAVNMCSIALTQQDVDSAVLKLNEASIFTPYTCLIKMDGVTRFQYFFATSTRFGEVFVALQLRGIDVGSPISGCQWIIKNGHSSAYPHEFLTEWGSDGATFYLVAHQSGGVVHRGVRTSIKKDDIIARVVKKSKETILRKVDRSLLLSVETPIPEAFAQILTQIEAKVITYHSKMVKFYSSRCKISAKSEDCVGGLFAAGPCHTKWVGTAQCRCHNTGGKHVSDTLDVQTHTRKDQGRRLGIRNSTRLQDILFCLGFA